MSYRGRVKNGVVVPEEAVHLPEGAVVQIVLPDEAMPANETDTLALLERLRAVVGAARGLPPDAAANVDHYLYGQPKRETGPGHSQ